MTSTSSKDHDVELREVEGYSPDTRDDIALARLGKKAVLKRRFGFLSILGYSCTVLITWEGSLVLFLVGLQNGGPAGVIYGYLVVWIGTISVFVVLSELVSIAPTSGGQYHWVSMLSPPSIQKLLSYISGWLTLIGWLASLASGGYLTSGLIQGLMMLCQPDTYVAKNWHVLLFYWAIILFSFIINVAAGWLLPKFEGGLLVLHILGFFGILIPMLVLGPKGDTHEIFTTFTNGGEFATQGLSMCVGLMGTVFAFCGGDGPIHLSEEIHNAQIVVPRSIMTGIAINGSLGFGMILTMLYRLGDLEAVTAENPTFPFMAIFHQGVKSRSGAAVMISIVMVLTISASVGFSAGCSRICWAFARDKGIPGWRHLSKVSDRTSMPVFAVAATCVVACLLGLINLGSEVAFQGVISVGIAGLFSSYLLTACLLLWRRCAGAIVEGFEDTPTTTSDGMVRVSWGPWRARGVWGIANNAFACIYLTFVVFFSFWPSQAKVTPETMNWSIVVTAGVAILSAVYYAIWARKTYVGPVSEANAQYVAEESSLGTQDKE